MQYSVHFWMFIAAKLILSINGYPMIRISSRAFRSVTTSLAAKFTGYPQPDKKHDAYEQALEIGVNFPCIILVNPYLDQNVGSVARCMLNFGFTELRIVNPVCDIYSEHCQALSAGAYKIVENAKVYTNITECLQDLSRVYATSNRPRHMTQLVYTPEKAAEEAMHLANPPSSPDGSVSQVSGEKVGLMFGRERFGLFNEELALCDSMITIPTFNHFSSLNLAQAVNLLCYEVWKQGLTLTSTRPPETWLQPKGNNDRVAKKEELNNFFRRLEEFLTLRNFQTHEGRRAYAYRNLRNIFQRVMISRNEVELLQGVLSSLISPPRYSNLEEALEKQKEYMEKKRVEREEKAIAKEKGSQGNSSKKKLIGDDDDDDDSFLHPEEEEEGAEGDDDEEYDSYNEPAEKKIEEEETRKAEEKEVKITSAVVEGSNNGM